MLAVPGAHLTDTRTFLLLDRLGKGGFGEVWRARMERQGFSVEVAVKLLHDGIDPKGDAARRLRDEARLLGLLHQSLKTSKSRRSTTLSGSPLQTAPASSSSG